MTLVLHVTHACVRQRNVCMCQSNERLSFCRATCNRPLAAQIFQSFRPGANTVCISSIICVRGVMRFGRMSYSSHAFIQLLPNGGVSLSYWSQPLPPLPPSAFPAFMKRCVVCFTLHHTPPCAGASPLVSPSAPSSKTPNASFSPVEPSPRCNHG